MSEQLCARVCVRVCVRACVCVCVCARDNISVAARHNELPFRRLMAWPEEKAFNWLCDRENKNDDPNNSYVQRSLKFFKSNALHGWSQKVSSPKCHAGCWWFTISRSKPPTCTRGCECITTTTGENSCAFITAITHESHVESIGNNLGRERR